MQDALLANEYEDHSMHDPTEGGLATGIFELVKASDKGILVFGDNIPVFPESQKLCDEFGLDFLSTITSGTLLVAADPSNAEKILRL